MRCIVLTLAFWLAGCVSLFAAGRAEHIVVVVWDGLRPDLVTAEQTPTLHRLSQRGVFFQNHHSVFLSATIINGTALATGAYPGRNRVIGNNEYRPAIDPLKGVSSDSLEVVRQSDRLTRGGYLGMPALAEILQRTGRRTAIAGSKGVVLLQDRMDRGPGALGFNVFAGRTLPESLLPRLTNRFGAFPKAADPNTARDAWTTATLLGPLWEKGVPGYSLLWLSEPDYSHHVRGLASPQARAGLKSSDDNLARVLAELERRGVAGKTDVFVVSDHGFSTISKAVDVAASLVDGGFKAAREYSRAPGPGEIVVVSNSGAVFLYVMGSGRELIRQLVEYLQRQEFTGVLFTREGLEGTFRFEQGQIDAPSAPDVAISMRWSPARNQRGVAGMVYSDGSARKAGDGMHVTLSPYDMNNTLVAAGPDFRRGTVSTLASGNVDVAPTILWILGIHSRAKMDGRILTEGLAIAGPRFRSFTADRVEATHRQADGVWRQYLRFTEVNGVRYLDEGNGGFERGAGR